jgi:hypothetical protein
MKPLYRRLFMLVQQCQFQMDKLAYSLYMRLIEDELSENLPEDDTAELAPRENAVHLPRRELH